MAAVGLLLAYVAGLLFFIGDPLRIETYVRVDLLACMALAWLFVVFVFTEARNAT